ncbi:MAG: hypothetical protein R3293_26300 [Candidatus Promineifilaceae bacterium]|nr:hypothetical protein [Candidatus Promineifilaceae bacterium]
MHWWHKRGRKSDVPRPVFNNEKSKIPPAVIDGTAIWLKNTSPYPLDRVKLLLSFAFAAVLDYGIEVHVKGSSSSYKGRAYNGIPQIANVIDGAKYLVTIGLARSRSMLPQTVSPRTKRQLKRYPQGIRIRDWEDVLVFVGAHEARHIWQFQARRTQGKQPISEVDAEQFAIQRLNDWRILTGDLAIPPVL